VWVLLAPVVERVQRRTRIADAVAVVDAVLAVAADQVPVVGTADLGKRVIQKKGCVYPRSLFLFAMEHS
jgi:hypothetical protein